MGHTAAVRLVGAILVLTACAAIQLPWFSCHSDCQHALLPVWELGLHLCHDEASHTEVVDACPCCPAHGHNHDAAPEDSEDDHDHGPGDHELQLQSSRRPAPTPSSAPDMAPAAFALLTPNVNETPLPIALDTVAAGVFDTGPPTRLASVRLLL